MLRFLAAAVLAAPAFAGDGVYELAGKILPPAAATVTIFGATTPFTDSTLADLGGSFHFRKLAPGAYTVAVRTRRGAARLTVEVGPGTANSSRRVTVTLRIHPSDPATRNLVSARQLSVPGRARHEYAEAQKDLARRDTASATTHLEKAVEIAPQFSAAWNNLGTIAYQTQEFDRAEECFRQALEQDPEAYEPLVNLGGVLISLHKLDEAAEYNQHAVRVRPNDALANAQLGITYFELERFDLSEKYLRRAVEIDPAHFSHPQLFLAEIHARQHQGHLAARDLEDFLKHHPDWPQAQQVRENIASLTR